MLLKSWYSFESFTHESYYTYLVWGGIGLIVIGLLITMPECSKAGVIGIINWVVILLGGLMYFGLLAMRNQNEEGNKGLYYLILYFGCILGLMAYFRRDEYNFETCQVFPYIILPQLAFGLIITLCDSSHSGCLLFYTIICSLFGLSVKVSCELIATENRKLMYKKGQEVSASQKMFTNLFVVCGECIYEGFSKDAEEKDIAVTFE